MSQPTEPIVTPARGCMYHLISKSTRCENEGKWMPVLLLYPSQLHWPSQPMLASRDVALCDEHKSLVTYRDLVSDKLFADAEKLCSNGGLPWPDRKQTRLKFILYTQSQLGKMEIAKIAESN